MKMKINWKWPHKINEQGYSNGLHPWYRIGWAALWSPFAIIVLALFSVLVGLVNFDWHMVKGTFDENC